MYMYTDIHVYTHSISKIKKKPTVSILDKKIIDLYHNLFNHSHVGEHLHCIQASLTHLSKMAKSFFMSADSK